MVQAGTEYLVRLITNIMSLLLLPVGMESVITQRFLLPHHTQCMMARGFYYSCASR